MLRYIYADQLKKYPNLALTMYRDRADQFGKRLGWQVNINANGEEQDEYDSMNPLYVIWEQPDGTHGGSMRFLPTVARTMINDHFNHLLGGGTIVSPEIWECTRFCLNRSAKRNVAAALMLGGSEIMTNLAVKHFVGVFDARMVRIYRLIGSSPEVLGSEGEGRNKISVGLWEFSRMEKARIAERAGVANELSEAWFYASFKWPKDGGNDDGRLLLSA